VLRKFSCSYFLTLGIDGALIYLSKGIVGGPGYLQVAPI
jgi:hypothetical protein